MTQGARSFRSCLLVAPRDATTMPLVRALHDAGLAVLERPFDPALLTLAASGEFDLVVWYAERPARADFDAMAHIAREEVGMIAVVPVLTATAASDCLLAGADACLQADADPRVVAAQALAVLRRSAGANKQESGIASSLQIGDITVDIERCEVERDGEFIPLTAQEYRIVEFMARQPGRVLRPHEILNAVSDGYEYLPRDAQEVLKVAVRRIRRKLEPDEANPRYIVTVRGFGYRLEGGATERRPSRATRTA
jgi:DNA-binding response OmpR family regulator